MNPDRLFSLEFDGQHKWCCNRSLSSIRFENCTVEGVKQPAYIWGDPAEPLRFELETVKLSARAGFGSEPVLDARHYSTISLNGVKLEGYDDPAIRVHTDGEVICEASGHVKLLKEE